MDIQLNREEEVIVVEHITILIGENEFRISQTKLGELIVNKCSFGEGSHTIQILPRVSNEIELK